MGKDGRIDYVRDYIRDATVREVYDHYHGSGSWEKRRRRILLVARLILYTIPYYFGMMVGWEMLVGLTLGYLVNKLIIILQK